MQSLNPRSGPVSPILVAGILLFGSTRTTSSQQKIGDAQTVLNNVEGDIPTGDSAHGSRRRRVRRRGGFKSCEQ